MERRYFYSSSLEDSDSSRPSEPRPPGERHSRTKERRGRPGRPGRPGLNGTRNKSFRPPIWGPHGWLSFPINTRKLVGTNTSRVPAPGSWRWPEQLQNTRHGGTGVHRLSIVAAERWSDDDDIHFVDLNVTETLGPRPGMQWLHLQREVMDFDEFTAAAYNIPKASEHMQVVILGLLKSVRKALQTPIEGHGYISPSARRATSARETEDGTKETCATFLSMPYLEAGPLRPFGPSVSGGENPAMSLSQWDGEDLSTMTRTLDSEQLLLKYSTESEQKSQIIYLPTVWGLIVENTIITYGPISFADLLDESIHISTLQKDDQGRPSLILLTDATQIDHHFHVRDCESYYDLVSSIIHQVLNGNDTLMSQFELMYTNGTVVTGENWLTTLRSETTPFLRLQLKRKAPPRRRSYREQEEDRFPDAYDRAIQTGIVTTAAASAWKAELGLARVQQTPPEAPPQEPIRRRTKPQQPTKYSSISSHSSVYSSVASDAPPPYRKRSMKYPLGSIERREGRYAYSKEESAVKYILGPDHGRSTIKHNDGIWGNLDSGLSNSRGGQSQLPQRQITASSSNKPKAIKISDHGDQDTWGAWGLKSESRSEFGSGHGNQETRWVLGGFNSKLKSEFESEPELEPEPESTSGPSAETELELEPQLRSDASSVLDSQSGSELDSGSKSRFRYGYASDSGSSAPHSSDPLMQEPRQEDSRAMIKWVPHLGMPVSALFGQRDLILAALEDARLEESARHDSREQTHARGGQPAGWTSESTSQTNNETRRDLEDSENLKRDSATSDVQTEEARPSARAIEGLPLNVAPFLQWPLDDGPFAAIRLRGTGHSHNTLSRVLTAIHEKLGSQGFPKTTRMYRNLQEVSMSQLEGNELFRQLKDEQISTPTHSFKHSGDHQGDQAANPQREADSKDSTPEEPHVSAVFAGVRNLYDICKALLGLYFPVDCEHAMISKCWGVIHTVSNIVGTTRRDTEARRKTQPRYWVVRSLSQQELHQKGLPVFDFPVDMCDACSRGKTYRTFEHAFAHVQSVHYRKHAKTDFSKEDCSAIIRSDYQYYQDQRYSLYAQVVHTACLHLAAMLVQATQIRERVATAREAEAHKLELPASILRSFESMIMLLCWTSRSFTAIDTICCNFEENHEAPTRTIGERKYLTNATNELNRSGVAAVLALESADQDLLLMVHTSLAAEVVSYKPIGPEYLMLCALTNLANKKLHENGQVMDLYKMIYRKLSYDAVKHPRHRVLRDLQALQEEIRIVDDVGFEMWSVLRQFQELLKPSSLEYNNATRQARFSTELQFCVTQTNLIHASRERTYNLRSLIAGLVARVERQLLISKEHQSNNILVFTIVTIIFLPLSFITSYMGMNTVDIRDMEKGQWLFWTAAMPVTTAVVATALLVVFKGDSLREFLIRWHIKGRGARKGLEWDGSLPRKQSTMTSQPGRKSGRLSAKMFNRKRTWTEKV